MRRQGRHVHGRAPVRSRWRPRRRTVAFASVVALTGLTAAIGLAAAPAGADRAAAMSDRGAATSRPVAAARNAVAARALAAEGSNFCSFGRAAVLAPAPPSDSDSATASGSATPTRTRTRTRTPTDTTTPTATDAPSPTGSSAATTKAPTRTVTPGTTGTSTAAATPADPPAETSAATDAPTETGTATDPAGGTGTAGEPTGADPAAFRFATLLEDPTEDPTEDGLVATPDSYTTTVDVPVSANVRDNDTGPVESSCLVDDVSNGELSFSADGSFTYQPDPGFVGTDSFSYLDECCDGETSDAATATIDVQPPRPTAAPDVYDPFTTSGVANSVDAAHGVLTNDTPVEGGGPLSAEQQSDPANGTVTLSADGGFTYSPAAGFSGYDTFTYRAAQDFVEGETVTTRYSDPATVTVVVTPPDPTATDDAYTVARNSVLSPGVGTGVLANDHAGDGGTLTAELLESSGPEHGLLDLHPDGSFVYTPGTGYVGTDSFSYVALEQRGETTFESAPATVTITVTSDVIVPPPPPVTTPPPPVTTPPTTPPVTTPPVTKPPVTKPPVTKPPVTKPPVTKPPVTKPPVTKPPVTKPPVTTPPVTTPPTTPSVTTPPVTNPPVTVPPATLPPLIDTPVVVTPVPTSTPSAVATPSSTPVTSPPAGRAVRSLRLTAPSVIPGGELRAAGTGCAPNSAVLLTISGRAAGSGSAGADGHFDVPVTTTGLAVGTYSVTATCGDRRQVADVALVYVTANSTAPTAQVLVVGVVLAFFLLLLGLVVRRPS